MPGIKRHLLIATIAQLFIFFWAASPAQAVTFDDVCVKDGPNGFPSDPNIVNCLSTETQDQRCLIVMVLILTCILGGTCMVHPCHPVSCAVPLCHHMARSFVVVAVSWGP